MAKKQAALPGMEPSEKKLAPLHDAAEEYAEIRDERQQLTLKEVALKQKLIDLMHKFKKEHYECEDVTIDLVLEEETVKVRIKHPKAEEEDAA